MFFQFAAWHQNVDPNLNPPLEWIEALFKIHPQTLLEALELYFTTRVIVMPDGHPMPHYDMPPNHFPYIGFLFYLWIIRYNYSNAFLQRWP